MPRSRNLDKYLDAGAEFVALTRTQARARAQELVQQGQLAQNQVQGFVDGLVEESRRRTDLLMDVVRQEIQRQVQAVGIATKDDLVKLEAKLAKQTKAATKSAAKLGYASWIGVLQSQSCNALLSVISERRRSTLLRSGGASCSANDPPPCFSR